MKRLFLLTLLGLFYCTAHAQDYYRSKRITFANWDREGARWVAYKVLDNQVLFTIANNLITADDQVKSYYVIQSEYHTPAGSTYYAWKAKDEKNRSCTIQAYHLPTGARYLSVVYDTTCILYELQ